MTGHAGACWFFDPEDEALNRHGKLLPVDDKIYANSTPIAGVLDPTTKAPDPEGEYYYFARQHVWQTRAGAATRYITNGGGGWGDPTTREPERVLADVQNEYVSVEAAKNIYRAAITGDPALDPEGLAVDIKATEKLQDT